MGEVPDKIWLKGLACRVRLGVPAAERRKRQTVTVDLGLELDLSPAAARDDFRLTVDYAALELAVRRLAETGECALVETLAESLAAEVLRLGAKINAVTVLVHKKPAVMPRTREVVVAIRRARR